MQSLKSADISFWAAWDEDVLVGVGALKRLSNDHGESLAWTGSAGTIHSAAAKAGVMSMTQTLAVEWAPHNIRVNAVAPGPIESAGAARQLWNSPEAVERITRTVPLGRWGQPSEVADAAAFLVSDHAAFIRSRSAR